MVNQRECCVVLGRTQGCDGALDVGLPDINGLGRILRKGTSADHPSHGHGDIPTSGGHEQHPKPLRPDAGPSYGQWFDQLCIQFKRN